MKKALLFLLAASVLVVWHMSSDADLDPALLLRAEQAWLAQREGITNKRYLTIVTYRKSLLQTRLYVVDRTSRKVVLASRVSHALNSGLLYANSFSNEDGSRKSCIGSFITQDIYRGKFGFSLRVRGVSPENDNALARYVIFHTDPGYRLSAGCWMTDAATNRRLINLIKGGSLVLVSR